MQSAAVLQLWLLPHLGQAPPQSVPVSVPSFLLSLQLEAHWLLMQMSVALAVHSPLLTHGTQLPMLSQNLVPPPPNLHAVLGGVVGDDAGVVGHVAGDGLARSLAGAAAWTALQPTQLPLPSQTWLLAPQLVPWATLVVTTFIIEQALTWQSLVGGGTSVSEATVTSAPPTQLCVLQSLTMST